MCARVCVLGLLTWTPSYARVQNLYSLLPATVIGAIHLKLTSKEGRKETEVDFSGVSA